MKTAQKLKRCSGKFSSRCLSINCRYTKKGNSKANIDRAGDEGMSKAQTHLNIGCLCLFNIRFPRPTCFAIVGSPKWVSSDKNATRQTFNRLEPQIAVASTKRTAVTSKATNYEIVNELSLKQATIVISEPFSDAQNVEKTWRDL